jgi:hypothetical protein
MEHSFGTNEYVWQIQQTLQSVIEYETRYGPVLIRPTDTNVMNEKCRRFC